MTEEVICSGPPCSCTFTAWSEWSSCSKPCDGGQRFRARDIVKQSNDDSPCGKLGEEVSCNSQPCVDAHASAPSNAADSERVASSTAGDGNAAADETSQDAGNAIGGSEGNNAGGGDNLALIVGCAVGGGLIAVALLVCAVAKRKQSNSASADADSSTANGAAATMSDAASSSPSRTPATMSAAASSSPSRTSQSHYEDARDLRESREQYTPSFSPHHQGGTYSLVSDLGGSSLG